MYLLVIHFLLSLFYFYLTIKDSKKIFIISLAIIKAESIRSEIIIGFFKYTL